MQTELELAKSLKEKALKQLEAYDDLIVALSIKQLIPDFFDNKQKETYSINLINKNNDSLKLLNPRHLYLLEKRRASFNIKINDYIFPASDVSDELWNHVVKLSKQKTK